VSNTNDQNKNIKYKGGKTQKMRIDKQNLTLRDVLQLMFLGVALLMVKSVMVVIV